MRHILLHDHTRLEHYHIDARYLRDATLSSEIIYSYERVVRREKEREREMWYTIYYTHNVYRKCKCVMRFIPHTRLVYIPDVSWTYEISLLRHGSLPRGEGQRFSSISKKSIVIVINDIAHTSILIDNKRSFVRAKLDQIANFSIV